METGTLLTKPDAVKLTITCTKCTREQEFSGAGAAEASLAAISAGWHIKNGKAVCKRCPH